MAVPAEQDEPVFDLARIIEGEDGNYYHTMDGKATAITPAEMKGKPGFVFCDGDVSEHGLDRCFNDVLRSKVKNYASSINVSSLPPDGANAYILGDGQLFGYYGPTLFPVQYCRIPK